jgi:hypothetical protein
MQSKWFCAGLAALTLNACGGDPGSNNGPRGPNLPTKPSATGGVGGSATNTGGSFGNAQNPPRPPSMWMGGSGGASGIGAGGAMACEEGMFCKPTTPDGNCGTINFKPDVEVTRTPGNLLIVFDQSFSMEQMWQGTGKTKIVAARDALVAAITSLQAEVTVGAVFLPTASCFDPGYQAAVELAMLLGQPPPEPTAPAYFGNAVPAIDDPTQINFRPGAEFLTAWEAHWTSFVGGQLIGTPLQEGFDRAAEAIAAAKMNNLLAGSGQVAVVAFTDGEPNCTPDPARTMRDTMELAPRAADWLASSGIKTYVVGLPGANEGAATLNGVAQSGGTTQFIDPGDPAMLEAKLRDVISETVKTGFNTCSIKIDPVPEVPDELLMIVEEPNVGRQQVPRDRGWALDAQGGIEITGPLCDDAKAGRFSDITFEYACPDVPPPPPLPVPE